MACAETPTLFDDICVGFIKKTNQKETQQLIRRNLTGRNINNRSFLNKFKVQFQSCARLSLLLLAQGSRLAACVALVTASLTLPQQETRHVLVNHKSDAAGGSDADHVGDDAFVEAGGTFVPARVREDVTHQGGFLFHFNSNIDTKRFLFSNCSRVRRRSGFDFCVECARLPRRAPRLC